MKLSIISLVFGLLGSALSAEPQVNCPAPRSPTHGQAFLLRGGRVVKYVCEPGYALQGKKIVLCLNREWEEPSPTCVEIDANVNETRTPVTIADPLPPALPTRPLFDWGSEPEVETDERNSTSDEMLSDEARLRMVLYPRRRVLTSRVRTAQLHSASELEAEERKRSGKDKKPSTSTTIHLQAPPSVVYVRRTIAPGKVDSQEQTLNQQYRTASVHMTVDNPDDVDHVQVVSMPRAAVSQDDKGYQTEQTLRHMYWMAQSQYPRHSSLVEYRSGNPVVMTLSESQIAWINSLHPQLRDQYLRDLYGLRAEEAAEGARAQAFLRRYEDAYNMWYNTPLYVRQPASLLLEDPISAYDYSCHQVHSTFARAPQLPNAHIARYDRRQNPNTPHNHYLTAVYRCDPGYLMLDTRHAELHCSKRQWIGTLPICIRRG